MCQPADGNMAAWIAIAFVPALFAGFAQGRKNVSFAHRRKWVITAYLRKPAFEIGSLIGGIGVDNIGKQEGRIHATQRREGAKIAQGKLLGNVPLVGLAPAGAEEHESQVAVGVFAKQEDVLKTTDDYFSQYFCP